MKPADPTFWEFVRQVLDYDPETGVLVWVFDWGSGLSHTEAGRVRVFRKGKNVYRSRMVGLDGKRYSAHQLIWFWMTGTWAPLIDHRDGNSLNNKWSNLREATPSVNAQNRTRPMRGNRSGRLGVSLRDGHYEAKIRAGGKLHYLGSFKDPDLAHQAYVAAKRRLHPGCTL